MREILIKAYLYYLNNYLSVDLYAEHNGLTPEQGKAFIDLARSIALSDHPES